MVGFALEAAGDAMDSKPRLQRGRSKLRAQAARRDRAVNLSTALGADESEVVVLFADGREERLPRQSKHKPQRRRLVEVGLSSCGEHKASRQTTD